MPKYTVHPSPRAAGEPMPGPLATYPTRGEAQDAAKALALAVGGADVRREWLLYDAYVKRGQRTATRIYAHKQRNRETTEPNE